MYTSTTRRTIADLREIVSIINELCCKDISLTNSKFSIARKDGRYYVEADGKVIGCEFTFGEAYTYLRGIETCIEAFQENLDIYIKTVTRDLAGVLEEKDNKIHLLKIKLQQRQTGCDELNKLEEKVRDKTLVPSLASINSLLYRGKARKTLTGMEAATIEGWKELLFTRAECGMFSFPPKVVFQLLPSGTDVDSIARSCEALIPLAKNVQWALLDQFESKKSPQ